MYIIFYYMLCQWFILENVNLNCQENIAGADSLLSGVKAGMRLIFSLSIGYVIMYSRILYFLNTPNSTRKLRINIG